MTRLVVRGFGAVSPAGWGTEPLVGALKAGALIPAQPLPKGKGSGSLRAHLVPPPTVRPAFLAHPRFRRSSAISQFAMAAATEALGPWPPPVAPLPRLGIVMGVHAACIRYSERFFGEVLDDPATASPLLFPETVINAPASHLAASFGASPMTYTVVGDQTAFVQALLVGIEWLLGGRVDVCLVVSAEEAAWPIAGALGLFTKGVLLSEGAGALVLARASDGAQGVALERITDAHLFAGHPTRLASALALRGDFPCGRADELLVDSRCGAARLDGAESAAWQDWPGGRISPKVVLGEALSAATAWQFVAACHALRNQEFAAANLSVVGSNEQAIGARFVWG